MRVPTLLLLLLLASCALRAQSTADSLAINSLQQSTLLGAAEMQLDAWPVAPGSLELRMGKRLLQPGVDYQLDAVRGRIHLYNKGCYGQPLQANWQYLRLGLRAEYRRYGTLPWVGPDSLAQDSSLSLQTGSGIASLEEYGRLRTSGSFLRGISVGSGGDVGMESGLRLKVEGQVGRDVEVEAFLSDRNLPVQADGRSQSLEEVDRIHIKLRSPHWEATLGDFDLDLSSGDYLRYARTVDGVQAGWRSAGHGGVRVHLAGARGRFYRMEFSGSEGVQGPWQLNSEQGSDLIVVLAGSERVWLDGVELARGQNRDYVMDYALGQLSFTARRPISEDSRIAVEFQYSERVYARTLSGAEAWITPGKGQELRLAAVSERDDPDDPLDTFLDDEDRELLAAAGDSTELAYGSGVREVDAGEGSYRLLDANAGRWGEYEFAEEVPDSLADEFIYELRFSELGYDSEGSMLGDYSRQFSSSGQAWFRFEGEAGGVWAPVIELVAPTALEQYDAVYHLELGQFRVEVEAALAHRDQNLLSDQDDEDNLGAALRSKLGWRGSEFQLGRLRLGRPGLQVRHTHEAAEFRTLSATDEIEYEREWGLLREGSEALQRFDMSADLSQSDSLSASMSYSQLQRGAEESRRIAPALLLRPGLGPWITASGSWRKLQSTTQEQGFHKQELGLGWDFQCGVIQTAYLAERLDTHYENATRAGERFGQYSASTGRRLTEWLYASVSQSRRGRFELQGGDWEREATIDQSLLHAELLGSVTGELDWSHRVRRYAAADSSDSVRDVAQLELRSRTENLSWSLSYGADNQLVQERVTQYIETDSLQGDYSPDPFNPDVFIPDPDGNYIAVTTSTGRQARVAAVRLNTVVRAEPVPGLLSDTRFTVEESSALEDVHRLYLLQPAALLGDSTRSGEIDLTQDVDWRPSGASSLSLRVRHEEQRSLDQLQIVNPQRGLLRKEALRARWRKGANAYSLELSLRHQRKQFPAYPESNRSVRAWMLRVEWDRELARSLSLRTSLDLEQGREEAQELSGRRATLHPLLEWRPGQRGTLRADFSLQQVWSSAELLPYELLSGGRIGRTLRAGLEGNLQLSRQSRLTLSWRMNQLPERPAVHTARAQIQAFF